MPMRVGEMMVVIRAQDFASRTLRRVGTEFAGMSRMQAAQAKALSRMGGAQGELRRLKTLQRQIDMTRTLTAMEQKRASLVPRATQATGTGGRALPLTPDMRAARVELAKLDSVMTRMSASHARLLQDIDALPRRYRSLSRSAADVAEKLGNVSAAQVQAARDAQFFGRMIPVERMQDMGHAISGIGRVMQLFGAVGTGAFALSANSFANFSAQVSLAATQMRDISGPGSSMQAVIDRSKELGDAIIDMMLRFPAAGEEMASAAYDIFSSMNIVRDGVVNVGQGMKLLEIANKAAVAGQVSLDEATSAMIVTLNNFDPNLRHVGKTMDEVFSIVRFGQMRLNDFATGMAMLAPIASSVELSLKDVGGAFAALTILTKNQSTASAGLGRAIELFNLPVFTEGLKKFGVETKDANHQLRPLFDIMQDLVRAFPEMATGQKSAIEALIQISQASGMTKAGIQGTIQARRAIASLATHMGLFANVQKNVNKNTGEMATAFETMMQDPGVQWKVFLNQMKALVLLIGREALPVFIALGERIAKIVKWFQQLSPETRGFIVRIGAIGAIFALVGGVLLSVIGALISVRANLMLTRLAAIQTTASFAVMRTVIGSIAFLGVGMLLTSVIGVKRAVIDLTIVWLVWKSRAIAATVAVAAANIIAARSVKIAWRAALSATGFGLLAVAAGIAADYIITHWDQVRAFFIALKARTVQVFVNMWSVIVARSQEAVGKLLGLFVTLANAAGKLHFIPGMGGLDDAARDYEAFVKDYQQRADAAVASAHKNMGSNFWETYNKAVTKFANQRKKRGKDDAEDFMQEWKDLTGKLVSDEFLKGQEDFANSFVDNADTIENKQKELMRVISDTTQQALDSLRNMYSQLQSENETAFGALFQGPWLTSETFDVAKEWGITPRIQDIIKDLDMQITQFAQRRAMIDKLFKRGIPKGFLDELKTMSPEEAMPILQELVNATPKETQKLIGKLKQRERDIKKATMIDFTREINQFKKAGNDMGRLMIEGFQNAGVGEWFDVWIKSTFPGIINSAVATAVKDFKANNPAAVDPKPSAKTLPPRTKPRAGTGITPRQRRIEEQSQIAIAKLTAKQTIEQIERTKRRIGITKAGGVTKAEQAILARQNRRLNRLWRHQDELRGPERKGHGRDLPRSAQPKRPLGNTNNTNNSKTINVKMETKSVTGDSAADKRRQAFILAGKLKSLLA